MRYLYILILLFVSGCSSTIYGIAQSSGEEECRTLAGSALEECEAQYQKSYSDYQKEREALLETRDTLN